MGLPVVPGRRAGDSRARWQGTPTGDMTTNLEVVPTCPPVTTWEARSFQGAWPEMPACVHFAGGVHKPLQLYVWLAGPVPPRHRDTRTTASSQRSALRGEPVGAGEVALQAVPPGTLWSMGAVLDGTSEWPEGALASAICWFGPGSPGKRIYCPGRLALAAGARCCCAGPALRSLTSTRPGPRPPSRQAQGQPPRSLLAL